MNWRNEQIDILRQKDLLTEKIQVDYFENLVAKLFDQEQPSSYLENDKCIGYGGLVHINWNHKNAEISFIMNTELVKDSFRKHGINYLQLIEKIAFKELNFHIGLCICF